ncbi:MAG TPA: hypothetical protein DHV17_07540 [Chitinophagaceae bacterium]|nr:hypothetical protein [Chitinophagaceae bacterium]
MKKKTTIKKRNHDGVSNPGLVLVCMNPSPGNNMAVPEPPQGGYPFLYSMMIDLVMNNKWVALLT